MNKHSHHVKYSLIILSKYIFICEDETKNLGYGRWENVREQKNKSLSFSLVHSVEPKYPWPRGGVGYQRGGVGLRLE